MRSQAIEVMSSRRFSLTMALNRSMRSASFQRGFGPMLGDDEVVDDEAGDGGVDASS